MCIWKQWLAQSGILAAALAGCAKSGMHPLMTWTTYRDGRVVDGAFARVSNCDDPLDACVWSGTGDHSDQATMSGRVQFGDYDLVLLGADQPPGRPSSVRQVVPDEGSSSLYPRYFLYWGGPWVVVRGSRPIIEDEHIVVLAGIGMGPPGAATQPSGPGIQSTGSGVRVIEHRQGGGHYLYVLGPEAGTLSGEARRVWPGSGTMHFSVLAGEEKYIDIANITSTATLLTVPEGDTHERQFVNKVLDLLKDYDGNVGP